MPPRSPGAFARWARLAGAAPIPRPGTPLPGASAPLLGAPRRGGRPIRRTRLRRSLHACLVEGMLAEGVTAAAGGAALTAWALHLGFGPLLVGALGAVPVGAQALHLVGARLTATIGARTLAIAANAIARLTWIALPLLGLLPTDDGRRVAFLAIVGGSAAAGAIGNHAWVAWMGELVPDRVRGRYFGGRLAITTLAGTSSALLVGLALDRGRAVGRIGDVLAILSVVAAVLGVACALLMVAQHDPGGRPQTREVGANVRAVLADGPTRALLAYQVAWNAAVGVAAAFFGWYMIAGLGMDYLTVALYGAATAAVRVLAAPLWGRAIDRVGAVPVLAGCSLGAALLPAMWLFPAPGRLWPLAIESVASGGLWGGHALAAFAAPLEILPRDRRPWALGVVASAAGIAFAVGALAGGAILQALPPSVEVAGRSLADAHVVFLLSTTVRLAAAPLAWAIGPRGARDRAADRDAAPAAAR